VSILLTRYVEPVADALRQGGGVPYSAYCPDITGVMDGLSRDGYDRLLIDASLLLVPGLTERLQAGSPAPVTSYSSWMPSTSACSTSRSSRCV
jgi:hypothetical protein